MDLLCIEDFDPLGREVGARDAYIQDIYHSLLEEPGTNFDMPSRGLGLMGWLSAAYSDQWPRLIEQDCKRNELTTEAVCTITQASDGSLKIFVTLQIDGAAIALEIALDVTSGAKLTVVS